MQHKETVTISYHIIPKYKNMMMIGQNGENERKAATLIM